MPRTYDIVHASDAYYLPRDSTPHDRSLPKMRTHRTRARTATLRGSTDFHGVHSRASEVIVGASMIDSDYRYTQDAHQKDRRVILHTHSGHQRRAPTCRGYTAVSSCVNGSNKMDYSISNGQYTYQMPNGTSNAILQETSVLSRLL